MVDVELVVKVGGGLLEQADAFDAVMGVIGEAGARRRLMVVPGGGAFADAVRAVDRRLHLPDAASHWMAVLAMDQYAHVLEARLARSRLVRTPDEIGVALAEARVPILAPFTWLRHDDPLPHTWDVTSDSIAAWVAGAVGATRLVLVKPAHARPGNLVDPCFQRTLPATVTAFVFPADQTTALAKTLTSNF